MYNTYFFLHSDIDECIEGTHNCQQVCNNSPGTYSCSCNDGFSLDEDSISCSPSCGGVLTSPSGSFNTPGWPDYYPSVNFKCEWIIMLEDNNSLISLDTDDSAYGILGRNPCSTDYLEFYDGPNNRATSLGKFCFVTAPADILTSANQAMVVFQASSNSHPTSRVGVRVTYEAFRLGMCDCFYKAN